MKVGLLWYDNDPARGLPAKVQDAAGRYCEKFGELPDRCEANAGMLAGQPATVTLASGAVVRLVPKANILPHHFWIGVADPGGAPC